jgi:hypothetical protein
MLRKFGSQIQVLDPETSRLLATGRIRGEDGHGRPRFACTAGKGLLLMRFFGSGKRDVVIRSGANEGIHARLSTRWTGREREWTLEL